MNKLFTQLVEKRGLSDAFLHPSYEALISPLKLPDIEKALARIKTAISDREHIIIYGDYDVDGVTASALMRQALILADADPKNIEIMLPDRFADGYGMSPRLVERARATGTTLVITVDCGSRNHDIISALAGNHTDTIVTDHHECGATLPDALAVINPKRSDYPTPEPLKNLAGVGVAFELARALTEARLIRKGQEKWLLDLVLLGTICDSMPLTHENRILGYYGMKVLEKTRRPGLAELLRTSGTKAINSEAVGFQLGPRLNAAGRLASANLALDLLTTDSATTAASLAAELEKLNSDRRTRQRAATAEIATRGIGEAPVIVEAGAWHEGILGIIAGRLVETYHRPAFVLAETEPGVLKGSGRSFGDFNLAEALAQAGDIIEGGGGHAAAAGVRLPASNLADFTTCLNDYYNSLHLTNQERYLREAPDLTVTALGDFSLDLLDDLKLLEPFGTGNTEPLFEVTGAHILEARRMGKEGEHLRLDLQGQDGKILKTVAFFAPTEWFSLDDFTPYRFLIRPCENIWNGTRSVEARLVDIV